VNVFARRGPLTILLFLSCSAWAEQARTDAGGGPGRLVEFMLMLGVVVLTIAVLLHALRVNRRLDQARGALLQSEKRYRFLTEQMKDVVWTYDVDEQRFNYVSPSVLSMRGFAADEVMAQPLDAVLTAEASARVKTLIQEHVADFKAGRLPSSTYFTHELEQPCRDGRLIWTEVIAHYTRNEDSGHVELHGVTRDISMRKQQEERIRHMAQHDPLTGLANRALFGQYFETLRRSANRDGHRLALVFLDLDRFKPVNDQLGHAIGDRLLSEIAARLLQSVRESDVVARIGGDEFVILLRQVTDADSAERAADKLRKVIVRPFEIDGHPIEIGASLGIALYPDDGLSEQELLRKADLAMYQAKHLGGNAVCLVAGDATGTAPGEGAGEPGGNARGDATAH